MVLRGGFRILGAGALGVFTAWATMVGCQSETTSTGPGGPGGGNGGESGSTTTTGSAGGNSTSTGTDSTGSNTTGSGGSGGGGMELPETTIQDITTGKIGPGVKVQLKGVVAMSRMFLVSQSKNTGSCLWGVYLSAPGLAETAPNTGILAVSYGDNATIDDGGMKAFCPLATPQEPSGSGFPDDVKPGDVLDLVGKTAEYSPSTCGMKPGETNVKQFQLSNVSKSTKTGTTTPPTPHQITADEITAFATQTAADPMDLTDFHKKWGGVKVRLANVTAGTPPPADKAPKGSTNYYGEMALAGSGLIVSDDLFYQGYFAKDDPCRRGVDYPTEGQAFTSISGFVALDYCTWLLQPSNRCADYDPPSADCKDVTCTF